jgi:hypothetical protein
MESNTIFLESADSLSKWSRNQDYSGWDNYDALNSKFLRNLKNYYLKLFFIQFNKYSPINFRRVLKIEKEKGLKGIALFSQSFCKLYKITNEEIYKRESKKLLDFILENSLRYKYGCDCWSDHSYPYISTDKLEENHNIAGVVGTSEAIIALAEGYRITKDHILKETALEASSFLAKKWIKEVNKGHYLKYTLDDNEEIVYNASAVGLKALSNVLGIQFNEELFKSCNQLIESLIKNQLNDGSWNYSTNLYGQKRVQLDFHQGYIVEGMMSFLPYCKDKTRLLVHINKGLEFYRNIQFREDGTSYYRYPMPFPIDIHNQAQGIITFSKAGILDQKYLKFAEDIARWTIFNMQDKEGFFYYQKWPLFTNKIPHMRWSQAWMTLALSTLLEAENQADEVT